MDKERLHMKPSKRIGQIIKSMMDADKSIKCNKDKVYLATFDAIFQYLDEEYAIACDEATHEFNKKYKLGDEF